MTTAKRWLGTLARHYPSLLVSGVCHKALGEIEDLSKANLRLLGEVSRLTADLAISVEALESCRDIGERGVYATASAALAKIKETK